MGTHWEALEKLVALGRPRQNMPEGMHASYYLRDLIDRATHYSIHSNGDPLEEFIDDNREVPLNILEWFNHGHRNGNLIWTPEVPAAIEDGEALVVLDPLDTNKYNVLICRGFVEGGVYSVMMGYSEIQGLCNDRPLLVGFEYWQELGSLNGRKTNGVSDPLFADGDRAVVKLAERFVNNAVKLYVRQRERGDLNG